jgi:hypothetical protein
VNLRARSKSICMTRRNLLNKCKAHISFVLPVNHTNDAKTELYSSRNCHSERSEESQIIVRR